MYFVASLERLALVNVLFTLQFTPQSELYFSLQVSNMHNVQGKQAQYNLAHTVQVSFKVQ